MPRRLADRNRLDLVGAKISAPQNVAETGFSDRVLRADGGAYGYLPDTSPPGDAFTRTLPGK